MFESLSPELQELGLSPFFLQQLHAFSSDERVGRVACERRGEYEVMTARGSVRASLSGRLEHSLPVSPELDATGYRLAAPYSIEQGRRGLGINEL